MKTIAIGDIHGCFDDLQVLFDKLKSLCDIEKDEFVFLGDYIDRGPDSKKVVDFISNLQNKNENVIALKGNHEDMLVKWFENDDYCWHINGSESTLKSFGGYENIKPYLNWFKDLPLYYDTPSTFYVHAGINPNIELKNQMPEDLLWIRNMFLTYSKPTEKRVIFGHSPSILYNGGTIPYSTANGCLCLDTGCVYGGNLSALVIDEDESESIIQTPKTRLIRKTA